MRTVDINADVAEGFAFDDELLHIASSANVCCGAHAGSHDLSVRTVAACHDLGVRVGAHVGVEDRTKMGRAPIPLDTLAQRESLYESLLRQSEGVDWAYIKPHGWLYNASVNEGHAFDVVLRFVMSLSLPIIGISTTCHGSIAQMAGVTLIKEGFTDRRYRSDGTLAPRGENEAVLHEHEEIRSQVMALSKSCDSICDHGDTPGCVEIARLVRTTFEENGIMVSS